MRAGSPMTKGWPKPLSQQINAANGLHRSPKHPGREFGAAEIEAFALGRLAGGGFQHQVENPLAALLHRLLAVEDGATIDVHVVFHTLVHRRVGRKLDRGWG